VPIHDAYARITPYEILLPGEGFPGEHFPRIREEADERGGSVDTPESFLLLSEAALALREIRGEDDPPDLVRQHGALLYQAFHFWEAGQQFFLLDVGVTRFLVKTGPEAGAWSPSLPGAAGYLQFPHHLIWALSGDEQLPESVDGIFWSAPDGESLTLLIVMGMRKDRPGLVVVPLPTLPLGAAAPWASMAVRPEGEDFHSSLPGADLEGLYALEAGGEAVKLAMRIFWYMDVFPERVVEGMRQGGSGTGGVPGGQIQGRAPEASGGDEVSRGPPPTALPYRRIIPGEE
jgi:hypothetical protein